MTMDLVENEAARERLNTLRKMKEQRANQINELLEARENLEENMKMSHELLNELEKVLAEVDARDRSPELEELESIALSLEDRLQRALAQIQHTSLTVRFKNSAILKCSFFKAEPILTQIGEQEADQLRERLRSIGEQWKQYEDRVREKKRRLDERFADESELNNEIELLQFW
ncbi:unnamed protein product [Gongylonema pulchrum]|uniref:Flagellar FliJ protein n=1 Tax=Gongylonema pulchrum TaxID=637853 RepID=A0A183EFS6_9BILA|nr:unnamed protein product [Gongylonema pulchrum]